MKDSITVFAKLGFIAVLVIVSVYLTSLDVVIASLMLLFTLGGHIVAIKQYGVKDHLPAMADVWFEKSPMVRFLHAPMVLAVLVALAACDMTYSFWMLLINFMWSHVILLTHRIFIPRS